MITEVFGINGNGRIIQQMTEQFVSKVEEKINFKS